MLQSNLRAVTDGLGFLPLSNGVHYDSEPQRRPKLQALVKEGVLPDGYATDDGVGLHYENTTLIKALTEIPGKGAYHVYLKADILRQLLGPKGPSLRIIERGTSLGLA